MNQDNVPMMFRAQINSRSQLHHVDKNKGIYQDAHKWVNEWKKAFPKNLLIANDNCTNENPANSSPVPRPQLRSQQSHQKLQNQNRQNHSSTARPNPNNLTFARPNRVNNPEISQTSSSTPSQEQPFQFPKFGSKVKTWEYTISWRLVSNSGQDETVIRPVINAKGFPYFPGASMKGAFRRACISMQQANRYCGEKLADGSSKPGILRFHGAYPIEIDGKNGFGWIEGLVDIIHRQDEKQVISDDLKDGAKAQISLHEVKLKFGISSTEELSEDEWQEIGKIWNKTLAMGLGSRVSSGYGYFREIEQESNTEIGRNNLLLEVNLKGQGGTSQLIDRTKEFRPNMFKAALRGHTLRLLGGLTHKETAEEITRELWGGFAGDGSIVGLLGVNFDFDSSTVPDKTDSRFYKLPKGVLKIFCMHRKIDETKEKRLREIATVLIQFSMMFGGFGKSWRRICHKKFYPDYRRQIIGCHWEFLDNKVFYPIRKLDDIAKFINHTRNLLRTWIPEKQLVNYEKNKQINTSKKPSQITLKTPYNQIKNKGLIEPPKRPQNPNNQTNNPGIETGDTEIQKWREAWYSPKVQVWGRIAEDGESIAIDWLHREYRGQDKIRNPHVLAGSMGKTGRIWHRMYPNFISSENGDISKEENFIELLTIFPDESQETKKFLQFLDEESVNDDYGFKRIF
jgi:CRISPR-associated protein Cmr6